jgi:hypothetical protein
MTISKDIDPARVTQDTPLRLKVAAKLAFPDGSISVNSLRREIAAGRLEAMKIAGKHFVTLRGIGELGKLCRVVPKDHTLSSKRQSMTSRGGGSEMKVGSSGTDKGKSALAAAQRTVQALSGR